MITIVFVDDGQDFLEWDINEKGEVVDCRPFQAWLWVGMVVQNKTIRTGDHITYKAKDGTRHTLVHAVAEVKQIARKEV